MLLLSPVLTCADKLPGITAAAAAIAGETHEWETVEYVTDARSEGRAKALILLGHIASEQAGMEECARWLRTFLTGVPIEFVATSDMWAPPGAKAKPTR